MKRWAILASLLALASASGCIRFYFWAGERELTIPPEPAVEPTPSPDVDLRV